MEGKILIVEDDPRMQRLLRSQLTAHGFVVTVAASGEEALSATEDNEPDLILLDITLPGMDGLATCRALREWSQVPIILVTAADAPQVKVSGLEQGADDYLTKPFHMDELVARIRAVRRRVQRTPAVEPTVVQLGALTVDLVQRSVRREDRTIHLTKIEFDLLRELIRHANKVLTYEQLQTAVWGYSSPDVRASHVHICNLRRKLESGPTGPRYIQAIAGVGYRLRLSGSAEKS